MLRFGRALRGATMVGLFGLVTASVSLAPGVAQAATLTSGPSTLRYTAQPGEANNVYAFAEGRVLVLTDTGATPSAKLPASCKQDRGTATLSVRCDAPGEWLLRIDLGDGDDRLEAETVPRRFTMRVNAGSGIDSAIGGLGDDEIFGGPDYDDMYGGGGDDLVDDGPGDGYVRGHSGNDDLRGGPGLEFIIGDSGNDTVHGGGGIDLISTEGGNDVVIGGAGVDIIDLGPGDDVAYGGAGADTIDGGPGSDRVFGEDGDDDITTRDGQGDTVDCGAGKDVARVDAAPVDNVRRNCERIREPKES
jgi:Ca2+-binding RTX toxin-like protein